MSDGELAGCVLLKEGTLFGECRPLLWPNNSPRRKEGGGSLDNKVCVCRVSFRRMLFFLHVSGRDVLLVGERTAGAKEMV